MCFAYFYTVSSVSCFFLKYRVQRVIFKLPEAFVSCLHLQGSGALPESVT